MTDLVRSTALRPGEDATRRAAASRQTTRWSGALIRIAVRLIVALGLALLAFVFLEAWLPGVVLATIGSWFLG